MTILATQDVAGAAEGHKSCWTRVVFYVALVAWNAYFLAGIAYTVWMRHHPHVQPGANNAVLSLLLDFLVLGNLVILGVGFIVRRLARR
jgi:hypothetical protein